MTVTEAKALIHEHLKAVLKPAGFRYHRAHSIFERAFPGGQQSISRPFVDHGAPYKFSLIARIQLDDVSDIYERLSNWQSSRHYGRPPAAMVRLGFFTTPPKREYHVGSPSDIADAFSELTPLLTEKILPFFDRHRDVRSLDASWRVSGLRTFDGLGELDDSSALIRLIVARLAGNPSFEDLAGEILAQPWSAKQQATLEKAVAHLRTITVDRQKPT